jgi:hypothetical protein
MSTPLEERPGLGGAIRRQWPWVAVTALAAAGIVLVLCRQRRAGLAVLGGAMLVGGLLRAVLAEPGILAVRSKGVDLVLYFGVGLAVIVIDAVATVAL